MKQNHLCLLLVSLWGCQQERVLASFAPDAATLVLDAQVLSTDALPAQDVFMMDAANTSMDASMTIDAGTDYCEGSGPPILVGDTTQVCSNHLAVRTFRYALCLCEEHTTSSGVMVDAFNSENGPYTASEFGGSIGVNGRIQANAGISTSGSLWVGSSAGITSSLPISVAGDMHNQGAMNGSSDLSVGLEARIGGPIELRDLLVTSTLTVPLNATVNVSNQFSYGAYVRAGVTVDAPCDCAPEELVDIVGYVQHHATENDNALAGIPTNLLDGFTETTSVTIDCGRIYFSRVEGSGSLHLTITGRTAIFIAGELNLPGEFTITLEPGAELDLFIEGHLVTAERVLIGSQENPSSVRMYLGGTGSLLLSSDSILWANVYAPRAELVTSGPLEVFGSLFLRRLNTSSTLDIHYDKAVLEKANDCPPPSQPVQCMSCRDCLNQACINGQCANCRDNRDCCSPLFCSEGVCKPSSI
jgi:hypothetical protein